MTSDFYIPVPYDEKNIFFLVLEIPREISCKDRPIKDTNGMDLTEAEVVKKRWQEYTEELYKKDPNDQKTTVV